jgi:MscS family membrane protein
LPSLSFVSRMVECTVTALTRPVVSASLFSLILVFPAPVAGAQDSPAKDPNVVSDTYLLRPPDTSSPRDTLRSFLTNADKAIEAWRRETQDNTSDRAWMSAVMTLDFSTTPDSDSWSNRTERVLLLKEILDRIEVPADNEIPGDDEVSKDDVTRWTVPNTRITIERIEQGPRAGEFLFSAATVERLYRSYNIAKELPYKANASSPGIYEAYTNSDRTLVALERELRTRLQRVNTSSPRSTLRAFLANVNRAWAILMDADIALKAKPPTMTKQQALEMEKTANDLLQRAAATLDLSRVPAAHRKAFSIEAVLKLKEVLDRTILPGLEDIPEASMLKAAQQQESQSTLRAAGPFRWRYPNTEIEIVEITKGDRQGEFLFSARTVSQISDFYGRIRQLPYRSEITRAERSMYAWSGISKGFYDYFVMNPGYLVPGASFLGGMVDILPGWFKTVHGELTVWQWTGLLLCILAAVFTARAILRFFKILARRLNPPLDDWVNILGPTLILVIVIAASYIIGESLTITGPVRNAVTTAAKVIGIVMVIWAVIRLCKAVAETVIASPKIRDRSLDASLLRITASIASFIIGGLILIVALRDLGADLVPLLAGLGIGGLAVALAAQRTLANFIGSLILFANKPVNPGDFCRYGDQIGTVERIGLLSTQIRSLERTIVTVPNAEFSEMKLDNFTKRDQRLLKSVLQLRYETTPEQMRYVLAKLRGMLLGHPKVTPAPARVRFIGYGAYSKDLEVFAYLRCQDQDTFLAIQEDVLLRMEDIVNEAGSGFAFPSQTAYLLRDKGLDRERKGEAEARVRQWRGTGKLPFPEFADNEREKLNDILDYPPKGSPHYQPPEGLPDKQQETRYPALSMDDLVELPSFAAKLQETNPLAEYLRGQLSVETRNLLSMYDGGLDPELKEALVKDLNRIVFGPSIYEADRFGEVKRRQETQVLLDSHPEGENLARLNRLLLEDAYPQELFGRLQG